MQSPKAFFPVIVTEGVSICRDFFINHFNFKAVFDEDWYCHLIHDYGTQIAFLATNQPSQPEIIHMAFQGSGVIFSFEVEDVDLFHQQLLTKKPKMILELKTEPWGQRHFMIQGPTGLVIDVIQNMNPELDAT